MKVKSYKIHLDAIVCFVVLFLVSLGGNIWLLQQYNAAADQNVSQSLAIMVNEMNLGSQENYIKKLQSECGVDLQTKE
ncbi:MAG: hypothetical protein JXR18_07510 [Neptuniibacter sp.]